MILITEATCQAAARRVTAMILGDVDLSCKYFDNAATTALCGAAKEAIVSALDTFGNPSSFHKTGQQAADMLESARHTVASFIKARDSEIYFTSGGTESDNLAVIGGAEALCRRGNRIVTTAFEHSAVLGAADELEKRGFEVIRLAPEKSGTVSFEQFCEAINENTILVSCMSVNNETGAILPIEQLGAVIKNQAKNALFHVDATQSFGKYAVYPARLGIDLMSFSAHKIHGPKGVGALYIAGGKRILSIIHGGEQQSGIRPGTEPTALIAGFAAAVNDIGDMAENQRHAKRLRDDLIERLRAFDDILINSPADSSDYVLNLSLLGFKSETLLHYLDARGFCVSSGSACAKGRQSHVLSAMGLDKRRTDSALRISFSKYNTEEDTAALADALIAAKNTLFSRR